MTEQTAGTGHNLPPEDSIEARRETIHADLGGRFAALLAGRDSVVSEFDGIPEAIKDDETAGKVGDFIKKTNGYMRDAEGSRKTEKEPYLEGGRLVDGFFNQITSKLKDCKDKAQRRLTLYQREKAEEERRLKEEEARKAREAEEARRREEEEAKIRAAALEAAAAEAKQPEAEAPMSEAAEQQMAKAATAEALADQHAADATKADRLARAKSADLSRTRGDFGSTASLRERWDFELAHPEELDLNDLRPFFRPADIEHAIRSYVRQGGRDLPGVRIFKTTSSVVR